MKKKALLTAVITILMSQNVFADNCDDLVTTWKSLYSAIQGKTYTQAAAKTITTPIEWEQAIVNAYSNLEDKITLQIAGFNDDDYNLSKLKNYDVSISAKGFVSESQISTIDYSFEYNPNYKLARVVDNATLFDKLSLEEKEVYNILYESTKKLTENLETDYEKEAAIHNFITDNFKYGPLDMNNVPQRAHSVTGFVADGQGICEAYANTFYIMGKMARLDVSIITGTANNVSHMWNQIKLDGEYYHVDVTNDDPPPDVPNRERYTYFNVSDDIISKTHSWERNDFPQCTADKYNYYSINNYIIHNEQELKDFINNCLNSGNTSFTFRTENYAISGPDIIKYYTSNKGFSTINITGEYGKDATYNVTLK
ncbi:MAG: transglutaminase domain-containing protein [Clostridia bacterium]|nr:transglutaminase domain-containing protein [Clostridia bacterium]